MIQKIKVDIDNLLKDLVFEDKSVGFIEDSLAEILEKFLNETDLVDYWIEANFAKDNSLNVRIGLQEGEFENTKISYIDYIVK